MNARCGSSGKGGRLRLRGCPLRRRQTGRGACRVLPACMPLLIAALTAHTTAADTERLVKLEAELESIRHHIADMQKLLADQ